MLKAENKKVESIFKKDIKKKGIKRIGKFFYIKTK
jgi:hypothetical protein